MAKAVCHLKLHSVISQVDVYQYGLSQKEGQAMPLTESQLIAIEEHCCYQGLLGAGQAGGNMQNSPLMRSLREKGGQHPIFEVY